MSPYESTIDAGDEIAYDEEEFQDISHPIDYNNFPSVLSGLTLKTDNSTVSSSILEARKKKKESKKNK